MATKTIDVQEAQHQLAELVAEATAGIEVILTDGKTSWVRLVPVGEPHFPQRVPGLHTGSMTLESDFNAPLPDEFWTGTK